MGPSMITVKFIILIISLLQTTSFAQDRTLISKINPGCDICEENSTLVYVKAIGECDTIHQIWDFTRGAPTMIFIIAGTNSSIDISWDGVKAEKFVISEPPCYSFATSINKLYEYNDLGDVGRYDWHMPQMIQTMKDVKWQLKNSTLNDKEAMIVMQGSLSDDHRPGFINVKLDLLPYKDSAEQLPHLIHTANSTQFDISLVNLTTYEKYNSSRFAVHMLFASTDGSKDMMRTITRKSLDDEHTPGVFEMIEIQMPRGYYTGDGGFLQFRPVAYTQSERGVASSTLVHLGDLERASLCKDSTLCKFYADFDQEELLVEDTFVSFGEPGDGFYKQHNYTAWSFTIGYGTPPIETFSPFVIAVLTVGISLPVLLALSGIMFVISKRMSHRSTSTRLTEDN